MRLFLRLLPLYPISNFSLVWVSMLTFYRLPSTYYEKKQLEMPFPLSNLCAFMNSRETTLSKSPNLLNAITWTMTWQRMLDSYWRKIILCYVRTDTDPVVGDFCGVEFSCCLFTPLLSLQLDFICRHHGDATFPATALQQLFYWLIDGRPIM